MERHVLEQLLTGDDEVSVAALGACPLSCNTVALCGLALCQVHEREDGTP